MRTGGRLQERIQSWWQKNPMVYDWRNTQEFVEGSPESFEEIDRRFFASAFYAQSPGAKPFSGLIDFSSLKGKDVLEAGCGSGAHARLLAESGCRLTAIDLTPRAVALTRRRLELWGLQADVRQADAEQLPFEDCSFDFIWSWGVIHHTENTEKALAEMCRVLRPGGRLAFMVYHRASLVYWVNLFLIHGLLMGKLLIMTMEEVRNRCSDGLVARYFTRREIAARMEKCWDQVETQVFGQFSELLPLHGLIREPLVSLIPVAVKQWVLSRFGSFLWATGIKRGQF